MSATPLSMAARIALTDSLSSWPSNVSPPAIAAVPSPTMEASIPDVPKDLYRIGSSFGSSFTCKNTIVPEGGVARIDAGDKSLLETEAGKRTAQALVVAINGYAVQVFVPLNALGSIYRQLKNAFTDVELMFDILETSPRSLNEPGGREPEDLLRGLGYCTAASCFEPPPCSSGRRSVSLAGQRTSGEAGLGGIAKAGLGRVPRSGASISMEASSTPGERIGPPQAARGRFGVLLGSYPGAILFHVAS